MPHAAAQRKISAQVRSGDLVSDRRQRIVSAAITVFRREGFHVATTKDVAAEAGITQSNIYNYVKSKGDILYLACEHLVELYHRGLDEALERNDDPYERIVEALRAVIVVMFDNKDELLLLYNETHSLDRPDRKLILNSVSRFIWRFQNLIDDYCAMAGPLRVKNRRLAANLISFVPAILALRWWDLSVSAGRAEAEAGVFEFILGGLGIPAPGAERRGAKQQADEA
ncbi:MAG: TetR/AcrR family transcriptional regulator [Rhizobiaceae bacterium]